MDMLAPVPEAKAAAAAPRSSALIPCSSAWRLGLLLRVYINPREYVPSASRSNVVERGIGDETAPVAGSMVWPAWTASVSIFITTAIQPRMDTNEHKFRQQTGLPLAARLMVESAGL